MNEWKRVFCSPGRLAAAAVILVLSTVFFYISRLGEFDIFKSIGSVLMSERYYSELVGSIRGAQPEEAESRLDEDDAFVTNYAFYMDSDLREYLTEEEIAAVEKELAERAFFAELDGMESSQRDDVLALIQARAAEAREELEYVSGYPGYLRQIQTQASQQSQTAIFGDKNSFSYRNLIKTADEFAKLEANGVEAEMCASRGFETFIGFELADYLYLLFLAVFVMSFFEERRAGLWCAVRACPNGRARLGLTRVAVLAAAATLGVAVVYGANFVLSVSLAGGWGDLSADAQSVPCLRSLTLNVSIGEFFAQYLCVKAASGFLVGLLLWCVLGVVSNSQFTLAVLGATLAAEFALFRFLPVQSIFNPLKYFNIFSYVMTSSLYTDYLNVDLFGYPFGIRSTALLWLPILAVALAALAVLITARKNPEGNRDILSAAAGLWDRLADRVRRHLTAGGWEVYKTLIYEGGVLLLVFASAASAALFNYNASYISNEPYTRASAYLELLTGPISERTDRYIEVLREDAGEDAALSAALDEVEAYVARQREDAAAGGYEPWVFPRFRALYEGVFGPAGDAMDRMRAAEAVVFLVLLVSAMSAYERQSNMVPLLRSQKRGRRGLAARKLAAAFFLALFVFAVVYWREWRIFAEFLSEHSMLSTLYAPLKNSGVLVSLPVNVTAVQYITAVYVLRFVMLYLCAAAVMLVGSAAPNIGMSYLLNFAVLGVPALLYALGFGIFGFVTPAAAISAVSDGFWSLGESGSFSGFIPCAVWLVLACAAAALLLRGGHRKPKKAE